MALPQYTLKDLLESGVQFGHQTHRWNPFDDINLKLNTFFYQFLDME